MNILKDQGIDFTVKWRILDRAPTFNPITRKCRVCLKEKFYIISQVVALTLSRTGGIFPSTARGGVNLTQTYLTASEGPLRHILCNIIEGTFKGDHQ